MGQSLSMLEVSDTPSDMGYRHGSLYKKTIQQAAKDLFETTRDSCPLSPSKEECLKLTARYIPHAS